MIVEHYKGQKTVMVQVSFAKVSKAFMTFKKAYGSGWVEARSHFKKLVYVEHFNKHVHLLTEDEARRVELMISPHGHALCKVMIEKLLQK